MAKRNKKKSPRMSRWVSLPERDLYDWLGQFFISSMVMATHEQTGKIPKKIRVREGNACLVKQPDGSGLLSFEVSF